MTRFYYNGKRVTKKQAIEVVVGGEERLKRMVVEAKDVKSQDPLETVTFMVRNGFLEVRI